MFTPQRAQATMSSPCTERSGGGSALRTRPRVSPLKSHHTTSARKRKRRILPKGAKAREIARSLRVLRGPRHLDLESNAAARLDVACARAAAMEFGDQADDEEPEAEVDRGRRIGRVAGIAQRHHRVEEPRD